MSHGHDCDGTGLPQARVRDPALRAITGASMEFEGNLLYGASFGYSLYGNYGNSFAVDLVAGYTYSFFASVTSPVWEVDQLLSSPSGADHWYGTDDATPDSPANNTLHITPSVT